MDTTYLDCKFIEDPKLGQSPSEITVLKQNFKYKQSFQLLKTKIEEEKSTKTDDLLLMANLCYEASWFTLSQQYSAQVLTLGSSLRPEIEIEVRLILSKIHLENFNFDLAIEQLHTVNKLLETFSPSRELVLKKKKVEIKIHIALQNVVRATEKCREGIKGLEEKEKEELGEFCLLMGAVL
jgi:hypothetical protein